MRVSRSVLPTLAMALASCGNGGSIADHDMLTRVTADRTEVGLGKGFPLTVVRVWSRTRTPTAWTDELLAPLVVRRTGTERREDDRHVEETRHYLAYAFLPGEVRLAPLDTEPLVLQVEPELDASAPGPAELPVEPGSGGTPWMLWICLAAVATLAVALAVRRRHRRAGRAVTPPSPVPAHPPPPGPEAAALRGLEALRGRSPAGHEEFQAFYGKLTSLLRVYAGERFDIDTRRMCSEELIGHEPVGRRELLAKILPGCDLVKFARHQPDAEERLRALDAAERFIRETA